MASFKLHFMSLLKHCKYHTIFSYLLDSFVCSFVDVMRKALAKRLLPSFQSVNSTKPVTAVEMEEISWGPAIRHVYIFNKVDTLCKTYRNVMNSEGRWPYFQSLITYCHFTLQSNKPQIRYLVSTEMIFLPLVWTYNVYFDFRPFLECFARALYEKWNFRAEKDSFVNHKLLDSVETIIKHIINPFS